MKFSIFIVILLVGLCYGQDDTYSDETIEESRPEGQPQHLHGSLEGRKTLSSGVKTRSKTNPNSGVKGLKRPSAYRPPVQQQEQIPTKTAPRKGIEQRKTIYQTPVEQQQQQEVLAERKTVQQQEHLGERKVPAPRKGIEQRKTIYQTPVEQQQQQEVLAERKTVQQQQVPLEQKSVQQEPVQQQEQHPVQQEQRPLVQKRWQPKRPAVRQQPIDQVEIYYPVYAHPFYKVPLLNQEALPSDQQPSSSGSHQWDHDHHEGDGYDHGSQPQESQQHPKIEPKAQSETS